MRRKKDEDGLWSEQGDTPAPVEPRVRPPASSVRTSATHEAYQGQRVTCCGDVYILVYQSAGTWWGANLGPKGAWEPTFLCKVPHPFIFVEDP